MDGSVVSANEKFLQAMGYRLDEIKGRHHRIFLDEKYASSDAYQRFWKDLNRGESQTGEFERRKKNGSTAWISASYTVVMDKYHNPLKVIKFAMDITEQKLKALDFEGQMNAVNNTMASIEFNLDGTIVKANDHFLSAVGYSASEIVGQHHSMFIDAAQKESASYLQFWNDLRGGTAQTGDFKRYGKNKKEIWINASYTPIKDAAGKIYKIVKFAQDITDVKLRSADFEGQVNAINNTMASIEFNLDGKIVNANSIFLKTVCYGRDEVLGQHHSIFVDPIEVKSRTYSKFWEDLREGKAQTGEFRRLSKSGNEIWINASYTPIKDPAGKVYKIIKFAQDITELKAMVNRKSA
jgi:methyl-accepting chemotaxis protein